MDRSVVAAEESQWKRDSGASASKSLGSIVQINSIAIEISGAMEEIESPVHGHFSIRGYVAEMRKNDREICSPFTSEGNNGLCNLPPLSVPTFRWWRCSNCIPDIPSEMRKELVMAGNIAPVVNSGFGKHKDGKCNDLVKNIANSNLCCIRGRKATTSKKPKKDIRDKGAGTRCYDMQEANPSLQISERPDTVDASDIPRVAHPPCTGGEVDHVSSGSDDASGALLCKRKPKLRSLADIMVKEKKSASDTPKTQSASSSGVHDTSTETEPLASPHLEFIAPTDEFAKASSSPQRKRKNAFEEDRGLLETVHPSGSAKKSKGHDADRTCKRLVSSEQESEEEEEDASTKLNSLVAAKAHLVKLRKAKPLVSRKSKQSQTEDRMVLARDLHQGNSSCLENLEENVVSAQSNVTKIRHGPNSVEETGQISKYFPSGNQREIISTLPSRERPEVEADRRHLAPPLKSASEDGNGEGKVALDLSLNSYMDVETNSNDQASAGTRRFIPDLNEEFPIKATVVLGKQLSPLLHNKDLPMWKTTDGSVSCFNEEPIDVERRLEVSSPENNENGKKIIASASDDIPMEIVELLAKNQHERALGISKKQLMAEEISSSTRGYPPLYADGRRNTMCFPFGNRRSVVNTPNRILGIPVDFSQLSSCSQDTTKPQESQFRFFNSFAPSEQRKMQFSGSSSSIIPGPRISSRSELYWPPRRDNEPFALGLNQNRSVQPSKTGMPMPLFADKHGRGKNVSEMERKKSLHEGILIKKGRIGSSSKSVGSLDPYSNDTIPAMQLLSLMDQGISSRSSSFKASPKNYLEKPPSLGPRVNGKENQNVLSGSLFSQSYKFKDLPELGSGVFVHGESSKKGQIPLEMGNSTAMIQTSARSNHPPLVICTLNKNPADFSIPDARNKYTITARDLKPRKRIPRKQKPQTVAEDGRKRQRVKRDVSSSGKSKTAPQNI